MPQTIIPSDAAGFSITASASLVVDGATSGTFLMPFDANIQIIATSISTFKITTIYAAGTWTPTITAGTGAFTTTTVNSCRYKKCGAKVLAIIDITLTAVGTGAGAVIVTLPFAPADTAPTGVGSESAVVGFAMVGVIAGSSIYCRKYDWTLVPANGWRIKMTIGYDVA
jgi:hypothetical protein